MDQQTRQRLRIGGALLPSLILVVELVGYAAIVSFTPLYARDLGMSGAGLVFMDKETYDQVTLPRDLLGDAAAFLQDGMDVVMELYEEEAISVQLPDTVEATIVEADAVVKGQTASSSYKPAVLDNGVRVMVPPHIASGTRIVVDVYEGTYVRRAD